MTLLDGLDLSPAGGTMVAPIYPHYRRPDDEFVDYDDYKALQAALEAALALCRAYHTYIHCVPDHDAEEALSHVAHFETDLDIALEPFRKEGLG